MLDTLKQLDGLKAAGPAITKPLAVILVKHFTQFLNRSLDEGRLLGVWLSHASA